MLAAIGMFDCKLIDFVAIRIINVFIAWRLLGGTDARAIIGNHYYGNSLTQAKAGSLCVQDELLDSEA